MCHRVIVIKARYTVHFSRIWVEDVPLKSVRTHLGVVHGVVLARVWQDAAALFLSLLAKLYARPLFVLVFALPGKSGKDEKMTTKSRECGWPTQTIQASHASSTHIPF